MSIRPTRSRLTAISAMATAALLLTACGGGKAGSESGSGSADGKGGAAYAMTTSTPKPSKDIDSFTWSMYAEPSSLAFPYAFDYPPNTVLGNMCESLLRLNPDLSVSPGLASAVDNPNPTTWVYTIRDGVTFHDGTPLTADDVVASLSMHLNPKVGSFWVAAYRNVKSIKKTGAMQVTVTLSKPDSMWNENMAATPGTIESAAFLAKSGADYGNPSTGVDCTGPFKFGKWTPGQSITLERYDDYWDAKGKAKSAEVKFVFQQDPNTRVNALKDGEVDGGWMVPSNGYAQLKNGGPGKLYYGPSTQVAAEVVSNLKGPLGDPVVRKALLMATDREGIVRAGEAGVGEVTDSMVTKNTWGNTSGGEVDKAYDALPHYKYDVAAAKKLVAGKGIAGKKLVIATSPISSAADVVTQAVAQAARDIGFQVQLKTISPDKYTGLFSSPDARAGIDLFYTVWYTSMADPMDMFNVLRTGEFSNYGAWSDAAFDTAANKAIATPLDDPSRAQSVAAAQSEAAEQLPWLPLYAPPTSVWLGDRITGVSPSISYLYSSWAAAIGSK